MLVRLRRDPPENQIVRRFKSGRSTALGTAPKVSDVLEPKSGFGTAVANRGVRLFLRTPAWAGGFSGTPPAPFPTQTSSIRGGSTDPLGPVKPATVLVRADG